jgi:hypothetical protein
MTDTSTPEDQADMYTMWLQMELMDSGLEDFLVLMSLDANAFSESTDNSRKRKAASNSNNEGADTYNDDDLDTLMAEISADQKVHKKTLEDGIKHFEYGDNQKSAKSTLKRLWEMQDRRRALIKDMGGKACLKMLRETQSQDSRCSDVDEMEEVIEILKQRLATLQKYFEEYEKTMLPPASPSAWTCN